MQPIQPRNAPLTIIQITPLELKRLISDAVSRGVSMAASSMAHTINTAESTGEMWGVKELATFYKCSEGTIRNRIKDGLLPPRNGKKWRKGDVLNFEAIKVGQSLEAHAPLSQEGD